MNLSARHRRPPPEEGGRLLSTQTGGELSGVDGEGVHRVEEGASEVENRGEDEQQRGVPKNRFLGVKFSFSLRHQTSNFSLNVCIFSEFVSN